MRERQRFDVPGQMVDGDDRDVPRPRIRLRERDAHEERTDEARPLRHGYGIDVVALCARLRERGFDDAADVAHVLPRRQLGDDAAPLAMDVVLRGDDRGPDDPGPRGVAGFGDDRRGRLVARGLNREQVHVDLATEVEGPFQGLAVRRPEDALLGDDAGDVTVRRHVERRVADVRPFRRQARAAEVRHLALVAFLDRNLVAIRRGEVDRSRAARRRRTASCARARGRRPYRCRSCWRCRHWRRCGRRRRRPRRSHPHA